jgi:hypothetical protein
LADVGAERSAEDTASEGASWGTTPTPWAPPPPAGQSTSTGLTASEKKKDAAPAPTRTAPTSMSRGSYDDERTTAKRAREERAVTTAEKPSVPAEDAAMDLEGTVGALSQQAWEAYRAGRREEEVELLQRAVASAPRSSLAGLLVRLCQAQLAVGRKAEGQASCQRVVREFPGTGAAKVAGQYLEQATSPVAPPTAQPAAAEQPPAP